MLAKRVIVIIEYHLYLCFFIDLLHTSKNSVLRFLKKRKLFFDNKDKKYLTFILLNK